MHTDVTLEEQADNMDFAALLEESLSKAPLERGDIVTGRILQIDNQGLIIDVGWKHDGIVNRNDIERMGMLLNEFSPGDDLDVAVVTRDEDGNLILSAAQAKQNEDWKRAVELQEADEVWVGEVAAANKGGLIIPYGNLRGFVPASHVSDLPRGLSDEERIAYLEGLVGSEIPVKVIEVNRKRRRLVFSQRNAERESRNARKEQLLEKLEEGDVVTGIVSGLCDFGAFVDLGGADGLIHISELAWHRVRHPQDIVNIAEKVEVFILHLDEDGKRIGLSLKRLQPNPWSQVDDMYHIGQLVEGIVSRVEPFGAFISLDPGIEALLHVSQISDDQNEDPRRRLYEGQHVLTRVISIEADKQRLGLSLKEVTDAELAQWEESRAEAAEAAFDLTEDEEEAEAELAAETESGS